MPASMFTVIRVSGRDGRSRPHYVSLPLVTVLLEECLKYFTLPDEPEPPAEEPSGPALRGQLGVVRSIGFMVLVSRRTRA